MSLRPLAERIAERARTWGVTVEDTVETASSVVAFGRRGDRPVVLKVLHQPGDEWRCGEVLEAFGGRGVVRAYEHVGGAVLLERLDPGTPLARVALDGRDDEAAAILAGVVARMAPGAPPAGVATVEGWGKGFAWYLARGDGQIPRALVEQARHLYARLCASQRGTRLLHGDLQHYNVLYDSGRGWVAIDPKGVVGEVEYEIGASLRNPCERPALFATRETVERRLRCYEATLHLDTDRARAWGFAQAVLSAIWSVEDGFAVGPEDPALLLAGALRPLLP
jgi:streptomycin 6-kinase